MLVGMASGLSSGAFEQVWNYFDFDPKTRFSPSDLFLNILFSTVAGGVTGKIAQGTAITMVEEFDKAIENMYSIIIAVDATTWGNNYKLNERLSVVN
jgi:hypothetical protein